MQSFRNTLSKKGLRHKVLLSACNVTPPDTKLQSENACLRKSSRRQLPTLLIGVQEEAANTYRKSVLVGLLTLCMPAGGPLPGMRGALLLLPPFMSKSDLAEFEAEGLLLKIDCCKSTTKLIYIGAPPGSSALFVQDLDLANTHTGIGSTLRTGNSDLMTGLYFLLALRRICLFVGRLKGPQAMIQNVCIRQTGLGMHGIGPNARC